MTRTDPSAASPPAPAGTPGISAPPAPQPVPLSELARACGRIGILSFGGPAAQIALIHDEFVARRGWIAERDFAPALSFCMMLPGPEAMQLATWTGWRLRGVAGGLIAGGLFLLPGALVVLALSALYAAWGEVPLVVALFRGVQAAVLAVVVQALLRLSRRALRGRADVMVAVLAFLALFLFAAPFPLVIGAAALWGALWIRPGRAAAIRPARPALGHSIGQALLWGAVWLAPLALLTRWGPELLARIGSYFGGLALVTFGGAYAVLTSMTQEVVERHGWITLPQMIDGLGLAETTPGPLILVTEFVAYLAGHGQGGWPLGLVAAAVALWATFLPSFLFIFACAPWLAWITAAPRLAGALAGLTAAVVGVIANLSLWFAAHVLFAQVATKWRGPLRLILPDPASLDPMALLIALVAGAALWRGLPLAGVLAGAALVSIAAAAGP